MSQKFLPSGVSLALKNLAIRIFGLVIFGLSVIFIFGLIFHNPYLDGFAVSSAFGNQSVLGNIISFIRYCIGFMPTLFLFLLFARGGIALMLRWSDENYSPEYNALLSFIGIFFGAAGFGALAYNSSFGGLIGAIVGNDIWNLIGGWTILIGILCVCIFFIMMGRLLHIKWDDVKYLFGIVINVIKFILSALHIHKFAEPEYESEDYEEEPEEPIVKTRATRVKKPKASKSQITNHESRITDYELPSSELLTKGILSKPVITPELKRAASALEAHVEEFGVHGKIVGIRPGPVVSVFEFEPAAGVRTAKIAEVAEDLKVRMAAEAVRIAHIAGTSFIGIEIPNIRRQDVLFRPLVETEKFQESSQLIPMALGVDISGAPTYFDLTKMIHLLIAGHTGTGKSIFVQSIIMSLLFKFSPDECKLIIIDPKGLDFGVFDDIAHLMCPIIKNDPVKSVNALKWAVAEMDARYAKMQELGGVAKISEYNDKIESMINDGEEITREVAIGTDEETGELLFETQIVPLEKMPYLVIIVDEVADLMSLARKDVEMCVQRLAAKARAAGIHLVLATQRPDTSVITGTIKANFPARISFQAFSSIDSKTSLGQTGAERLLPYGDMLLSDNGKQAVRIHTAYISTRDIKQTCDFIRAQVEPDYVEGLGEEETGGLPPEVLAKGGKLDKAGKDADLYASAIECVVRDKKPTISYIQRRLGIGYNKAAGFIERMEAEGIVSAPDGNNKRHIL